MAEYIKREAVHNLVQSLTKYAWTSPDNTGHRVTVDADDVNFGVDKIPSADVAPVRHGRWLDGKCTVCGWEEPDVCTWIGYDSEAWIETPYCPNCGADMRGINDE